MSFQLQNPIKYAFKHKAIVVDDRIPPVINTWYSVLDIKGGSKISMAYFRQSNDEINAKDIEWEFTIDNEVYTDTTTTIDSEDYFFIRTHEGEIDRGATAGERHLLGIENQDAGATMVRYNEVIKCHAFKFRYRLISAAGTTQHLHAHIIYEPLEAV